MKLGGSPQGASPNVKSVAFWTYFVCIPIFFPSIPASLLSLPLPLPSHSSLPFPLPKEVNKKLSYCRQNALSIIKSSRHRDTMSDGKRVEALHIALTGMVIIIIIIIIIITNTNTFYVSMNDILLMQIWKTFKHLFCVSSTKRLLQPPVRLDLILYRALQQQNWVCFFTELLEQEVKVIWQKAPHGGPIPRLGVTPGGQKLYHWIPGVGFPISVP